MPKENTGATPQPGAGQTGKAKPNESTIRSRRWIWIAGGLGVAILAVAAVVVASGGDGSESTTTTIGPDDPQMEVSTETCEDIAVHIPMAMWNPVLADELLAKNCPWPQVTGFTDVDGGAEDPLITAPFESKQYQQIFDLIEAQRFGICAVGTFEAPATPGLVYGFRVDLNPLTCAEANPSVTIEIGEFATRALRDQAANDVGPGALVLGRWAINVTGEDAVAADILAQGVSGLGAYEVK